MGINFRDLSNSDGFTLLELLLAIAILTIIASAALGLTKEQVKLSSAISVRQNHFNDARVAMEFITREIKNARNLKSISAVDELRIVTIEGEPHGIVSWSILRNEQREKLVSDTLDDSYQLYYDSAEHKLRNKDGDLVFDNITKFDIKVPLQSFKLSKDSGGSDDDITVSNVYEITIQAGAGDDKCVLKSYIAAK